MINNIADLWESAVSCVSSGRCQVCMRNFVDRWTEYKFFLPQNSAWSVNYRARIPVRNETHWCRCRDARYFKSRWYICIPFKIFRIGKVFWCAKNILRFMCSDGAIILVYMRRLISVREISKDTIQDIWWRTILTSEFVENRLSENSFVKSSAPR